MKPDNRSDAAEEVAVLLAQDGSPACSQDDALDPDEFPEFGGLAFTEALLSLLGKQVADTFASGPGNDQLITVHEGMADPGRQASPDAALSASHEADEDDVRIHGVSLPASCRKGTKNET